MKSGMGGVGKLWRTGRGEGRETGIGMLRKKKDCLKKIKKGSLGHHERCLPPIKKQ